MKPHTRFDIYKSLGIDLFEKIKIIDFSHAIFRVISVVLISALLLPLFLFGDIQKTSANFPVSSDSNSAPVSAPPLQYNFSGSNSGISTNTTSTALTVASSVEFDFDGDNKADLSHFQPSNGEGK